MEATKNSTSNNQNMPVLCLNGCGFFGNPTFENYCSQCFRERNTNLMPNDKVDAPTKPQVTDPPLLVSTQAIEAATYRSLTPTEPNTPVLSPAPPLSPSPTDTPSNVSAELAPEVPSAELLTSATPESATPESNTPEENEPDTPARLVQATKSKCFMCRAKIPLAKQITNQCRCEYVFCNTHKQPDQHDCDYDHKSEGRAALAKNNPKLKENKGGRSFNRII